MTAKYMIFWDDNSIYYADKMNEMLAMSIFIDDMNEEYFETKEAFEKRLKEIEKMLDTEEE